MENRKNTGQEGKIGRHGEDLVCRHLLGCGHTILERNWRSGHLEIDIISMDSQGIHFVEVKSRRTPLMSDPVESVDTGKQKRIAAAASRYMKTHDTGDRECFFDVATVTFDRKTTELRYYPHAYIPVYV